MCKAKARSGVRALACTLPAHDDGLHVDEKNNHSWHEPPGEIPIGFRRDANASPGAPPTPPAAPPPEHATDRALREQFAAGSSSRSSRSSSGKGDAR